MRKLPLDESGAALEALLTFVKYRKFSLILREDLSMRPGLRSLDIAYYISHLPRSSTSFVLFCFIRKCLVKKLDKIYEF